MVQSACCYHFLLRFESFSKMEGYEGYFTNWIWWSILTFFTIFDIFPLWMDKSGWNWWPNWRVFDTLDESGKILDRYDPQNFWETLQAGAKKWFFSPFWLLRSKNLGTSEIENDISEALLLKMGQKYHKIVKWKESLLVQPFFYFSKIKSKVWHSFWRFVIKLFAFLYFSWPQKSIKVDYLVRDKGVRQNINVFFT